MNVRKTLALVLVPAVFAIAACSTPPEETAAPPAAAPPAAAAEPASTTPAVKFAEPADGATVKSPVLMKFAVENFTISPVPPDPITEVRPNTGHYHLAVDTECLAPGAEIVKGANWIHYGKGDLEATTQLSPGSHKLTLAVGDDKHINVPGMCTTITVNVEP